MKRRENEEMRGRRIFDKRPQRVSGAEPIRECRASASDVTHDGSHRLHRCPAEQAKPIAEIDILAIAEQTLVEAAKLAKRLGAIERGGCTRREALTFVRIERKRSAVKRAVRNAKARHLIAGAVQERRPPVFDLGGTKSVGPRPSRRSGEKLGQPSRFRKGVGIEEGDEGRIEFRGGSIVARGEAEVLQRLNDPRPGRQLLLAWTFVRCGSIIKDDEPPAFLCLRLQGCALPRQVTPRIIGDHNYAHERGFVGARLGVLHAHVMNTA